MADVARPGAEFRALLPAAIGGPGLELVSTTGARIRSPRKARRSNGDPEIAHRRYLPRRKAGLTVSLRGRGAFAQRPDGD
jgi:hypothetical protein